MADVAAWQNANHIGVCCIIKRSVCIIGIERGRLVGRGPDP